MSETTISLAETVEPATSSQAWYHSWGNWAMVLFISIVIVLVVIVVITIYNRSTATPTGFRNTSPPSPLSMQDFE